MYKGQFLGEKFMPTFYGVLPLFSLRYSEGKYCHLIKPSPMKEETCREKESYSSKEASSSIIKDNGHCGELKAYNKRRDNSTNCELKITPGRTNHSADSFDKDAVRNESASDKKCSMTKISSSANLTSTITSACVADNTCSLVINKVSPTTETEASSCSTSISPPGTKCTEPSKNICFKKGGGAVKGKRIYRKRTLPGDLSDNSPQ